MAIGMAAVLLGGCADQAATQRKDAQQYLENALATLQVANQGYTDSRSDKADVAGFRAATLAQAEADLEKVMSLGSTGQKLAAARLLGSMHGSLARHLTAKAEGAWAQQWKNSADLLAQVVLVNGAAIRAESLQIDTTPGQQELERYQKQFTDQAGAAAGRAAGVEKEVKQLQAQHQDLQAQSDQAMSQAQSLRQKAFVQAGAEQLATYKEALAAERQAQQLGAQAEVVAAKLNVKQSAMAIARDEQSHALADAKTMGEQIELARQRQEQTDAQRQEILTDAKAPTALPPRIGALGDIFTQTVSMFGEKVAPAYVAADEQAQQAVAAMEKAVQFAGGTQRQDTQIDLLSALATQLEVESRWISARNTLARALVVAADDPAMLGDKAQEYKDQFAKFQDQTAKAVEAAKAIKAKADELTEQLKASASDPDSTKLVSAQSGRIQAADTWIDASKM